MIKLTYKEKPSIFKSSLSLLTRRPRFDAYAPLPVIELHWPLPKIDLAMLHDYQKLCSYNQDKQVPICFPYVLCGPLHLQLLKYLPIPSMGLLHLNSQMKLIKVIDPQLPVELICRSGSSWVTSQGLEFQVESILEQEGKVCWSCSATFLRRGTFPKVSDTRSPALTKLEFSAPIGSFDVPGNIGRSYARICGDYNPIHISSPSAWLFGLKGSIAHGMWVAARSLALMPQQISSLDLAFKGPVFTGGHVQLVKKENDFNLFFRGNTRPVILGSINKTSLLTYH